MQYHDRKIDVEYSNMLHDPRRIQIFEGPIEFSVLGKVWKITNAYLKKIFIYMKRK